jgi:hypothetical protein
MPANVRERWCGLTEPLLLPGADGSLFEYRPSGRFAYAAGAPAAASRVAYAAGHVVAGGSDEIDWEATLAYRRHLWGYGLGVAEAMDTAQRGMGLDWPAARELIRRSAAEAAAVGGRLVCGVQTDQVPPGSARTLRDVAGAYEEQCEFVEAQGAGLVLMCSHELVRLARGADDYLEVYGAVLSQLRRPAIVHWLGEVFDPGLAGYWGHAALQPAMEVCLTLAREWQPKVEGFKLSLLDQRLEVQMRARLPAGVRMFTGDDFDYPTTIAGDGTRHSDALLGAFDMIAPAAAAALLALDAGDVKRFHAILEPTLALSRHVFTAPTQNYKTGVVFAAYLNGHQDHFRMLAGLESARSAEHLAQVLVLLDAAGLLRDPELAADRARRVLGQEPLKPAPRRGQEG